MNLTISDIPQKSPNPNYKEYQKNVDDFNILVEYQNVLITVLEKISELTYLLGKGGISSDMSYSLFNKFLEQSVQIRNLLEQWHHRQVKLLCIDLNKNRISKTGVEGFFSAIPGFVDNKWRYKDLKQGLVEKIDTQIKTKPKALKNQKKFMMKMFRLLLKMVNTTSCMKHPIWDSKDFARNKNHFVICRSRSDLLHTKNCYP